MTNSVLLLFLRKEVRDLRSNRQVWPVYFILPAVSMLIPMILLAVLPLLGDPARMGRDPAADLLRRAVESDPSLQGTTHAERLARLLLRDFGIFYLLIPVILSSGAAALALVREKEQRTLEPILATPLSDRELVLAKLLAAVGPALFVTWGSAALGTLAGIVGSLWRTGIVILPTSGVLISILMLAPALAVLAALAGLRVSARFTDVPAATQFTGLVVVPASLVLVALVGRPAMRWPLFALSSTAIVSLLCVWAFDRNVKRFRREEILTRWR